MPHRKDESLKEATSSRASRRIAAKTKAEHAIVRDALLDRIGAGVIANQIPSLLASGEETGVTSLADAFVSAVDDSIQPRDIVEQMLAVQMAWTHARLAKLTKLAVDQQLTCNVRVVNEACDRAANTFRRQMLALAEYRRPAQPSGFVAIKNANIANQQVVQNVEGLPGIPDSEKKQLDSNEQGCSSLPTLAGGAAAVEGCSADAPAVGE